MKKIALFYHSGSGNHGCEAIVRSTAKLLGTRSLLYSNCPKEDKAMGLGELCDIQLESAPISRTSLAYWKALIRSKVMHDSQAFDLQHFSPMIKAIDEADVILSIGGDMYCYGVNDYILMINEKIRQSGKPCILWGCSVEPDAMTGRVLEDLKGYTHIIARESITYNALREHGVSQVSLCPDPAFQLNRVDLPLPEGFIDGNTVGINVSPMILEYEKNAGMTMENYKQLIDYILQCTDMQIALIPHVVWDRTDDRKPLSILYNMYKESGRVCMLEDHNAEELKGYIARCRFMVAARTHASIAAYSTQVPTLVVGYSVKARGIARDIFGEDDRYVVPVQSLAKPSELVERFKWIQTNESIIRSHFQSFMPNYISQCNRMATIIDKI